MYKSSMNQFSNQNAYATNKYSYLHRLLLTLHNILVYELQCRGAFRNLVALVSYANI